MASCENFRACWAKYSWPENARDKMLSPVPQTGG